MSSRRQGLRSGAGNHQDPPKLPLRESLTQPKKDQPNSNKQILICEKIKTQKKLWKGSLGSINKSDVQQGWVRVSAQAGVSVNDCKSEFGKAKKSLRRRINDAISKGHANSWAEVEEYVENVGGRRNRCLPEIWTKLLWLAKELAEETLKKTNLASKKNLTEGYYFPQHMDSEPLDTFIEVPSNGNVIIEESSYQEVSDLLNSQLSISVPLTTPPNKKIATRRKTSGKPSTASKKKKASAQKKNADCEFHVASSAVAGSTQTVGTELPSSMMDIKYLTTEEDILDQQEEWRNAGPPVGIGESGEMTFNGASNASSFHNAPRSHFEDSELAVRRTVYQTTVEYSFVDNFGNVQADTVKIVWDIMVQFLNYK